MKSDRYFYPIASFTILLLTFFGFRRFYLAGTGSVGQPLTPQIATLVIAHGIAITGWIVLFFVQTLLIASNNGRLHMKLGWSAVGLATIIAATSIPVAILGARLSPDFNIVGFPRSQFLLIHFADILAFIVFVALGLIMRKQAHRHRAMLLMATMTFLPAATTRTPFFNDHFGEEGWWTMNGPQFILGALFVIFRLIRDRSPDRWLTVSYASLVGFVLLSEHLATGETWGRVAKWILQV